MTRVSPKCALLRSWLTDGEPTLSPLMLDVLAPPLGGSAAQHAIRPHTARHTCRIAAGHAVYVLHRPGSIVPVSPTELPVSLSGSPIRCSRPGVCRSQR